MKSFLYLVCVFLPFVKGFLESSGSDLAVGSEDHIRIQVHTSELLQILQDMSVSMRTHNRIVTQAAASLKYRNEDVLKVLMDQEERLGNLEKQFIQCRVDDQDKTTALTKLSERVERLEAQLNNTMTENEDLRRTLDVLQEQQGLTVLEDSDPNGNVSVGHRKPRDFFTARGKVAFDGFRNKPFHFSQQFVTYDGTTVNHGNGLNPETGVFTAPHKGIYVFSFHALTHDGSPTYCKIVHNGRNAGGTYRRHQANNDENSQFNEIGLDKAEGMLGQNLILFLEEGDEVGVFAYHGNLRDGGWHYTHFTGFML